MIGKGAIDDNNSNADRIALEKKHQVLKWGGDKIHRANRDSVVPVGKGNFSSSSTSRSDWVDSALPCWANVQQVIVAVQVRKPGLSNSQQIKVNEVIVDDVTSRDISR